METMRNKNAVRRLVERGLNEQDLAEFELFFAPDVVHHGLPAGLEGLLSLLRACFAAAPDLRVVIEELQAEDDRTVLRWSARGTWPAEWPQPAGAGERFAMTGVAIDRFAGGRSVEHWDDYELRELCAGNPQLSEEMGDTQ